MAAFAQVTILLMLVSISKPAHSNRTRLLEYQGGEAYFGFGFRWHTVRGSNATTSVVLYRSSGDGYLLIKNSSNPSQHVDSELSERVNITSKYFILWNVSLEDTGEYKTELWRNGKLRGKIFDYLVVCVDKFEPTSRRIDGRQEWVVAANFSKIDKLEVYRREMDDRSENYGKMTLILDTDLPFDIIPADLRGMVNVQRNDSTICISTTDFNFHYDFILWINDQCLGHTAVALGYMGSPARRYFLRTEERLILPCASQERKFADDLVYWDTPVRPLEIDPFLSLNTSHDQEEDIYIEPGNHSLIIPSVSAKHSGYYRCMDLTNDAVFVCPDQNEMHLLFPLGGTVTLACGAELSMTAVTCTFYRHVGQKDLSLKPEHMKVIHKTLAERWTMFSDQCSLTISNLTLNDSGLYVCRIWGYDEDLNPYCTDRKIYLLHEHPFGISSTFYRVYSSLIACGLLGMICAVISVHLKTKGRDRASQERLRRTDEPSGCST